MILPANYLDMEQGTQPWFEARLGCVTASRVADVMSKFTRTKKDGTPAKVGETATRRAYRVQVMCERLFNKIPNHYVSEWMLNGKEMEPIARAVYELHTGSDVRQCGFVLHPDISRCGASPDGLIGTDGILELKCPKPETHYEYLSGNRAPAEYMPQMDLHLACCEDRRWVDFMSYCDKFPEPHDRFIVRVPRNEERIARQNAEIQKFLAEVEEMLERLKFGDKYTEEKLRQSIALVKGGDGLGITEADCL